MIVEFADDVGKDYTLIVNLNLESSVSPRTTFAKAYDGKEIISAEAGHGISLEEETGLWLTPSPGALIHLGEQFRRSQTGTLVGRNMYFWKQCDL
ncbi:MAG: hypothetical protein ACUVXJ_15055 [Phycisphaerae bacterium]